MGPIRATRRNETGTIRKKWTGRLPVALLFPNTYRLAMSNLGMQLVYSLLNEYPEIVCERVFLPDSPSMSPRSIESSRPLQDFSVLFCALSFEQDYVNLLRLLLAGDMEPFAAKRRKVEGVEPGSPLVIGGGVATFINPEPLAPFMDAFLVGEAEPMLPLLLKYFFYAFHKGVPRRQDILLNMAREVPGCYVPEFYEMQYSEEKLVEITAMKQVPLPVQKVTLSDSERAGYSTLLTADTEFSNLFLAELGRGCSRGCRFCAAGFVYRPPRLWTADAIITALQEKPDEIKRVGLLGMEMADSTDLAKVSHFLNNASCSLSFSSLRADAISDKLLGLLANSDLKTAAIAPDGGSERLRRLINKNLNEEELLWAAEHLVQAGVSHLKLYFMIGLPTETDEDLQELAGLTFKIRQHIAPSGRKRGRLCDLTVSLNSFVPKAWTPFQYCAFAGVSELKRKIKFLRKQFAGQANIKMNVDKPDNAFFQAVLARGDRRVGELLFDIATSNRNWRQVFRQHGVEPEDYVRERQKEEMMPWQVISHGIKPLYLWTEYQRALSEKTTSPCDTAKCTRCGVCQ